ncbi:endothelin-converting enzyme Metallo peptidase. MEROPS family M13 [Bryocella elongata]|uniref:Endothelin-converting enzyme Metallo peptidase. MEROPS family M13 n=1 Tax=Bryocella elongata TaxID=863522 RepID=A0A1H5X4N6_9BACT|nr:M13 family metallopeptidase [Bryocella elongata]SEG06350.1 endothelin-converting enzyme Metallo peptidase. MEROPS family M13 [Bryocella elongata]
MSRFARPLVLAACLCSTLVFAQQPTGVRVQDIDRSVMPGDDFYLYANGEWQKSAEIPADRTGVDAFSIVANKTDAQLKEIFAELAKNPGAAGSDTHKVADLYASYMDEAAMEAHGLASFKPKFASIEGIKTRAELAHALGLSLRADTDALNNTQFHTANIFGLWVAPGFNDSEHYAPYLMQGGGSLPSPDYYLSGSAKMKSVREAFVKHAAKMFALAGFGDADARAARVLALETAIAKIQLSLADSEDIKKANNLWNTSDFAAKAPGLDWKAFFSAADLGTQKQFYVWQPTAIIGESALVASDPIDAWKDLLLLHLLDTHAAGLSKALADERFAFYGTVITGAPQQRPREQRAVAFANGAMGDAVGQIYVKRYFSAEARQRAQAMVANLLLAFHKRLEALDWMTPATKAEAIRKLDALKVGVGYPDHWRSYTGLEIKSDDLAGNIYRANLFDYHYSLSRIGKPVDRAEWCMEPQLVNAVNLPLDNGLNFPAAIMQPPFFDASAPDAYNYGAIGAVIGHEISHTFDSEGAAFDSTGKVRDWWTPADFAHFKQVTDALAAQFDGYEPFPGIHVNGRQTLGEDIADLGGVAASYDAFHAALKGKPAKEIDGLSGDQQFFLAFAQIWRTKMREATERARLLTDPHAPGQYRAETVRNFDAWYKAFDVQPGGKLYLTPEQRVRIW